MNLRVDLILESEQRSGSTLNLQSLKRIALVVGPAIVMLLVAIGVWSVIRVQHEYKMLNSEWELTEPQRKEADRQVVAFRVNVSILKEIEGWQKARIDWHQQLAGLLRLVPANVQLDTLRVSQNFQLVDDSEIPARVFVLDLRGKAVGENAEDSVRGVERNLASREPFSTAGESVKVPVYGADPSQDASDNDRVFGITCRYKNKAFE